MTERKDAACAVCARIRIAFAPISSHFVDSLCQNDAGTAWGWSMEPPAHSGWTSARHIAPPDGFLGRDSAIVYTDIVGSTELAESLGDGWSRTLADHHGIVRRNLDGQGAFEAGNQGDGFLYFFQDVRDAATAVRSALSDLADGQDSTLDVHIRVGIHWGPVGFTPGVGFYGLELHRGARVANAAGTGQVLLSEPAAERLALQLPSECKLVDLGEFWLKDLRRPERLFELMDVDSTETLPRARAVAAQDLPLFAAELVGRAELLDEIRTTVDTSSGVITSLCGPGGVGKTRLAVELLREQPRGTGFFVDLSEAESPAQMIPAIARAVGVDATRDLLPQHLARELGSQRALVVIDNVEQIVECAPEIGLLARRAPDASIVVTTRVPLRLSNENVIEVEPLGTDASMANELRPAGRLLAQLVGLTEPTEHEIETMSVICRELDGLPLAIELAAGRVGLLGLDEVAIQLAHSIDMLVSGRRDAPERHRTLTSTVLWSYALLSFEAQKIFRALSQFPSGATVAALEALETLDTGQVLTGTAELVEHHLVRCLPSETGTRFQMLRVIREVADAELVKAGELASTRVHAASYLRVLAHDAVLYLGADSEKETYARLLRELENFRLMFDWASDPELIDTALASASDLLMFWWHDHLRDGINVLRDLTELPGADRSRHFPRALVSMSILATYGGDPGESMRLAQRAVAAARETSPVGPTICTALQQLAISHAAHDQGMLALSAAEEALEVAQHLPDFARAMQLVGVGPVLLSENQVSKAEAVLSEAVDIFEDAGASWLAAAPVARLGECAIRRGDLDQANRLALDGIQRWSESPGVNGKSRAWSGLARVRWCEGNIDDARALSHDAAISAIELNAIGDLPWALIVVAAVAAHDERFDLAQTVFRRATSLARSYSQPILGALRHELAVPYNAVGEALGEHIVDLRDVAGGASLDEIMQLVEST